MKRVTRLSDLHFDLTEMSKQTFILVVFVAGPGLAAFPETWEWSLVAKLGVLAVPPACFIAGWCSRTVWAKTGEWDYGTDDV